MPLKHTALAAVLAVSAASNIVAGTAHAAPYAISYTGSMGTSTLSGANSNEQFSVTLIFDNGGTSASSQAWQGQDLTCVIWRFNNAQDAVYTQSLPGTSPDVAGQAATNSGGALTSTFALVAGTGNAGQFTAVNLPTLTAPAVWVINTSEATILRSGTGDSVVLATGGITPIPGYWAPPTRVTGPCDDTPYAAPPAPTPVPTLGHGALALLSATLAGLAGWRRRRGSLKVLWPLPTANKQTTPPKTTP